MENLTTQKVADSPVLQVMARASMLVTAPALAAVIWFGHAWLDGRFEAQGTATRIVTAKVDEVQGQVPGLRERVKVLENNQVRGRDERQRQNEVVVNRLDRMQDAIIALSNAVAGLTATIKAQESDRGQGWRDRQR